MPQVSRGEWLDPLNRLIWQRAIKKRMETVKLRNGQVFRVAYKDNGLVHVKPMKGFTPCGYWRMEDVLSSSWVHSTEVPNFGGASGS